jgi:protein-tyrosine phosphatase
LLKNWTKEVIRKNPTNILKFSRDYFAALEEGKLEAFLKQTQRTDMEFTSEQRALLSASKAAAQEAGGSKPSTEKKSGGEGKEKEHFATAGTALVGPAEKIFHVCDHLFLASEFGATDSKVISAFKIGHIVNCTGGSRKVPNVFEGKGVAYTGYALHDQVGENASPSIAKGYELLSELHAKKTNVIVHCSAGLSRSVTVVLGYLMKAKKLSMKEAVALVEQGRGRKVMCNASFWAALLAHERKLSGKPGAPPTFDFSAWVVDDFTRMGLAEKDVRRELKAANFDADKAFAKLIPGK